MPSIEEEEADTSGEGGSITKAEGTEVDRKFLCDEAPGKNEVRSEYPKTGGCGTVLAYPTLQLRVVGQYRWVGRPGGHRDLVGLPECLPWDVLPLDGNPREDPGHARESVSPSLPWNASEFSLRAEGSVQEESSLGTFG